MASWNEANTSQKWNSEKHSKKSLLAEVVTTIPHTFPVISFPLFMEKLWSNINISLILECSPLFPCEYMSPSDVIARNLFCHTSSKEQWHLYLNLPPLRFRIKVSLTLTTPLKLLLDNSRNSQTASLSCASLATCWMYSPNWNKITANNQNFQCSRCK